MRLVEKNRLWSIILAGGAGERLRPFVARALGHAKPKQFCAFTGSRSMFQHTLDRADLLSLPQQRVTVVAQSQLFEARAQLASRHPGLLVPQPVNLDTAAGVFLPLAHVLARDPRATVIIYPSDHFVYPEARFADAAAAAVCAAELLPAQLVLIGVRPDRVEPEYGWLQPGLRHGVLNGHRLLAVESFIEKPRPEQSRDWQGRQLLWNTFILAARASTLWQLGRQLLPEIVGPLEQYRKFIGDSTEAAARAIVYDQMPARNFSAHLLARVPQSIAVLEMEGVLWSDWGREERIFETLRQIGVNPRFPHPLPAAAHTAAAASAVSGPAADHPAERQSRYAVG